MVKKLQIFLGGLLCGLLICLNVPASLAAERALIYTPLPIEQPETVIAANSPLVTYLSKQLRVPITIRYEKNYVEILRLFQEGKIDIVQLGPLPYVTLRQRYAKAEPLVAINESDGKAAYTCAMVTAFDGPRSTKQVSRSVALSQPLSTCGHLTAGYLLDKHGIKLDGLHHDYLGNQDKVALAVVKGVYEVGVLKTAVAKKYTNLTLRIIEETQVFPGFLLVANKATMSIEQIKEISRVLLAIPPSERSLLGLGQYGFAPVSNADYDSIRQYQKFFR